MSTRDKNQYKEIQRRITAEWTAFAKHRDIFKGNIGTCLKRQVYNSCVLSAMTYGAETWTLTTPAKNKLAAEQTKMERSMLNITHQDRKTKRTDQGHRRVRTSLKTDVDLGTSAGHETTDGDCVSPHGNLMKEKDLEEDRRDVGETNLTTTGG